MPKPEEVLKCQTLRPAGDWVLWSLPGLPPGNKTSQTNVAATNYPATCHGGEVAGDELFPIKRSARKLWAAARIYAPSMPVLLPISYRQHSLERIWFWGKSCFMVLIQGKNWATEQWPNYTKQKERNGQGLSTQDYFFGAHTVRKHAIFRTSTADCGALWIYGISFGSLEIDQPAAGYAVNSFVEKFEFLDVLSHKPVMSSFPSKCRWKRWNNFQSEEALMLGRILVHSSLQTFERDDEPEAKQVNVSPDTASSLRKSVNKISLRWGWHQYEYGIIAPTPNNIK